MLSFAAPVFAQPVTSLNNRRLTRGVSPNVFEIAKVLPNYRSDVVDAVQNYRPISIPPSLGKVLQIVLFTRFQHFLNTIHMFCKEQKSFRNNMPKSKALVSVTEEIRENLDKGLKSCSSFFNFSQSI